jgi:hypothetical protein
MKAKLIKKDDGYNLTTEQPQGRLLEATCSPSQQLILNKSGDSTKYKLSKQNCDELFGVVDVEKLAEEYAITAHDIMDEPYQNGLFYGFMAGFNKSMELNKDKVFTLEDIYDAVMLGVCFEDNGIKGISTYEELKELAVKRASKPTEIEVEIIMSPCYYDTSLGGFSTSYTEGKPIEEPKLDKDGCMILKRV